VAEDNMYLKLDLKRVCIIPSERMEDQMANQFFENTREPTKTIGGKVILWMMNSGHNPMAQWGLSHVDVSKCKKLLDIGCGGGKNISNLLKLAPKAQVCGIDYSAASVEKSLQFNRAAVEAGRAEVREASVEAIPYDADTFDGVTAFETVYFWPNIQDSFREVARVLTKGGLFMVCNEAQRPEGNETWVKMLKMAIYTGVQIKELMERAGFSNIEIEEHQNGKWLCVMGRK
jgi:SAM-dependent methyltransferase